MSDKKFNKFEVDSEKQIANFENAKPNWFKARKSFIWVSVGLLAGAGIGTGVGFLVMDFHDKYDGAQQSPILNTIQSDKSIPFSISERDSNDKEYQSIFSPSVIDVSDVKKPDGSFYTNSQLGLEVLKNKIKNRLGFGPEAALLKSIEISGDGNWTDSNAVYFGATNQIYVKSQNIIKGVKKYKQNNPFASNQQIIEYAAEFVFQVVAHEYNHHLAEVYLNSRFNDKTYFASAPQVVKDKQSNIDENWDIDFYNTFTKALNYDGSRLEASVGHIPDFTSRADGTTYKSLANYYTAKQLFDLGNNENYNLLPGFFGKYSMFGQKGIPNQVFTTQDNLKYYYSLAELFARKMMQATMTTQPGFPKDYLLNRLVGANETSFYGADQWVDGEYSPLRNDLMMYADGKSSEAFFSDYIYNKTDNTNANKIFDSLISEMGYKGPNVKTINGSTSEQSDISAIWWENKSIIKPSDGTTYLPTETSNFRMGGYINNSRLNVIGYLDQNGKFIKLANISTSEFDLGVKSTIYSGEKNIPTGDKYTWYLDGYYDIRNFVGKDLVFAVERNDDGIKIAQKSADTIANKRTAGGRIASNDPLWSNIQSSSAFIKFPTRTAIEKYVEITPLVSFNSEATTWLAKTSQGQDKTGINKNVARPVENTNKHSVTLEVKKY